MAELHLGLSHSEQELRWEMEESQHNYGQKEIRHHHTKGKKLKRKPGPAYSMSIKQRETKAGQRQAESPSAKTVKSRCAELSMEMTACQIYRPHAQQGQT